MAKYELVVIYDPYLQETDYEAQMEKAREQIVRRGGENIVTDVWGRRQMAYSIKKKPEGFYAIFTFEGTAAANAASLAELERSLRLNETVLREMLVLLEPPKPPKPEKKKKPRAPRPEGAPMGDRGDRGDRGERSDRRIFTGLRTAGDAGAATVPAIPDDAPPTE